MRQVRKKMADRRWFMRLLTGTVALGASGRLVASAVDDLLIGHWTLQPKGSGVDGEMTFRTNKTYSYSVGIEGGWRAEHTGTWAILPSHLKSRSEEVLALTPKVIIKQPTQEGTEWLRSRRMLVSDPRKFWIMPSNRDRITFCETPYGDETCATAWTLLRG